MHPRMHEIRQRTTWFMDARFGMFIHWGAYAVPARGEWIQSVERIPTDRYAKYAMEFVPDRFDPRSWARLAREAGMRYAILTAKHHDGFCLFDSRLTDYSTVHSPARRDIVAEFVDAFRDEGLRTGLYYSLIDWHHEDYPHFGDRNHPMRDSEKYARHEPEFDRYLDYMHGQVRELCSNYGKLDILWFDFSYDNLVGDAWRATELIDMVRGLQPGIIVDNRLEASGDMRKSSLLSGNPSEYSGDFVSPEQIIPPEPIADETGSLVPWEACITTNNHWGYCAADREWKTPKLILRKLVECVSKGGNLLLNVGPDARGEIPAASVRLLRAVGAWMDKNGPSIYGCGPALMPKPEWGYLTRNGEHLYAHIFDENIGPTAIDLSPDRVSRVRLLADGSELEPIESWSTSFWSDRLFINFAPDPLTTCPLPDDMDTVVEIVLSTDE